VIRSNLLVQVTDPSGVSAARRMGAQCAEGLRMSENAVGRTALVTTELATNLVKHADGGVILFTPTDEGPRGVSILSLDKGRGIHNIGVAMQDGYSTAGSPGTGLGAVERAATFVDFFSAPGHGTAVLCRVDENERAGTQQTASAGRVVVGGICVAKPGEEEAGDGWEAVSTPESTTILVSDGLGHGEAAAMASIAAVRVLRERPGEKLEMLMHDLHAGLRSTRGAAVSVARIYPSAGRIDYTGVGNISAAIVNDDGVRRAVTHSGIVGHEMRKVQMFSFPWKAGSVLILNTDGISNSWNLSSYPGLQAHHPDLIAAVLYRDFARSTDDATVVVARPV
jgi:anti-sigma regulatory factor (Ser/Thr protein kinase)